jgi:hypothetical protein
VSTGCGSGSRPPRCMGSAVYGPSGCTCGGFRDLHSALAEVFADNDAVNRLSWINKAAAALAAADQRMGKQG